MNIFEIVTRSLLPVAFTGAVVSESNVIRFSLPEPIVMKDTKVDFAPVRASGINNINASYLGTNGKISDIKSVDWNDNIQKLWDQKLTIKNVSGATISTAPEIVERYQTSPAEVMSLNSHITQLNVDLNKVRRDVNWKGICDDFRLSDKQCFTYAKAIDTIDGEMLTAYSMTELMPYRNGEQSYAMMNMYMQEAGRNYLDSIPALGDHYLSMGRYQFTSYAVGYDMNGPRSANKIASYSRNYNIPGSVSKISGIDSDRAAFYFSAYNILSLVRSLNGKQVSKFSSFCLDDKSQLTEYMATAHHNPVWAKKRAISWISNNCKKPLISYQGERLKIYSIKTATNYRAILKHSK